MNEIECEDHSFVRYGWQGPHLGEYCRNCGKWLRWMPQRMTPERARSIVMPIGKHKGRKLSEIDSGYLRWYEANGNDGSLADACRFILWERENKC